jgi:transcriptional regulator with XRE-family HTH domain
MSKLDTAKQSEQRLGNYLRSHRRKAGLSQREIGMALGYDDEGPISRHERYHTVPPLMVALGYEVIFRVPVAEIFAGLRDGVEVAIEQRLAELEDRLQQRSARDRQAVAIARKLEWLCERRSSEFEMLP